MERRELWLRLSRRPNSVRFEELERLLTLYGWELDRVRGSHHVFRKGSRKFVLPLRRPTVRPNYVREALSLVQETADDE